MNGQKSSIKIGSYTLAMRGCELLRKNGITCALRKISDSDGKYGCLYAVTIDAGHLKTKKKILRSSGIMVLP